MTPRSIRRAAERRAQKEARREAKMSIAPAPVHPSTGPRTEAGKRISSLNAVKTGLTGRTVLLSSDDAEAYAQHLSAYQAEYQPAGLRETELVQSLADTQWRLARIPILEYALYARGRAEFADAHAAHDPATRKHMIDLDIHLKYEKQLRNLQLQESRLLRRFQKELAELRALQAERQPAKPQAPKTQAATGQFVFSNDLETAIQPVPFTAAAADQAVSQPIAR